MSFKNYNSSYVTPQKTLLEKFNAIIGFLESGNVIARFYMYKGLYEPRVTRYNKANLDGNDIDVGAGDMLVFQNRFLGVVDHVDGDFIIVNEATDIVTSVGHNYLHRIRLRLYYGANAVGRFYVSAISSTNVQVTFSRDKAFPDNAAYPVAPFYQTSSGIDTFTINGKKCRIISFVRGYYGKIRDTAQGSAGIMHFISETGDLIPILFNFSDVSGGGTTGFYWVYIEGDDVVEI